MNLVPFIDSHEELKRSRELIFFGGSFNPWHSGHSSCLTLAPTSHPIIVIPDHNPFKELTPALTKKSTAKDIQGELDKIETTTCLFEHFLNSNKKNPSHVWIEEVSKSFPEKNISLLMGFDTFISIDRWIAAKDVLNSLHSIYVASRLDDEKIKKEQVRILKEINPLIKIKFIGHHDYEELSSTQLRNS